MSNDDPNRGPGADGGVRDGKAGNDHEYGGLASERSTAPDSASARPQRLAGLDKRPARSAGDAKGEGAEGTDRAPQDSPAGELARNEDADLAEVLEQVPVEERQELFQLAAQITSGKQSWSGLLPRPEDFSGYAKHVQVQRAGLDYAEWVGVEEISGIEDAYDVRQIARVIHADDLAHGWAALAWEDMDQDSRNWYESNARAVRAHLLGED